MPGSSVIPFTIPAPTSCVFTCRTERPHHSLTTRPQGRGAEEAHRQALSRRAGHHFQPHPRLHSPEPRAWQQGQAQGTRRLVCVVLTSVRVGVLRATARLNDRRRSASLVGRADQHGVSHAAHSRASIAGRCRRADEGAPHSVPRGAQRSRRSRHCDQGLESHRICVPLAVHLQYAPRHGSPRS